MIKSFYVFCFLLLCNLIHAEELLLENTKGSLLLDLDGGVIREFKLKGSEVNPMHHFYGHFLCFDRWGPSTQEDKAKGIPFHGEGHKQNWSVDSSMGDRGSISVTLPIVNLSMKRSFSMSKKDLVLKVVETVTNNNAESRNYNLIQHVTIGAPFLSPATVVNTEAKRGIYQGEAVPVKDSDFYNWPKVRLNNTKLNLEQIDPVVYPAGSVFSFVYGKDEEIGWVSAVNPDLSLLLLYLWRLDEYPWFNIWTSLKDGVPEARGLEFGTTGLHKEWPVLLEQKEILNTPLFETLKPGETRTKTYYSALAELPDDFEAIETVRLEGAEMLIKAKSGALMRLGIPRD